MNCVSCCGDNPHIGANRSQRRLTGCSQGYVHAVLISRLFRHDRAVRASASCSASRCRKTTIRRFRVLDHHVTYQNLLTMSDVQHKTLTGT